MTAAREDFHGEYLGYVATHGDNPNSFATANTQQMLRTMHFARSGVKELAVIFSNFYVTAAGGEVSAGADSTVTASIEYPLGQTVTQLLFNGSAQGTIPNGKLKISDMLPISIPEGAKFAVRAYYTCAAGICFHSHGGQTIGNGDAMRYGSSGVTDQTMSTATVTNTLSTLIKRPAAIIGKTTKKSLWCVGDSRVVGSTDTASDGMVMFGEIERSVGKQLAYAVCACSSMTLNSVVNTAGYFTNRFVIGSYASHVHCNLGINDINASRSQAQIIADINTFKVAIGNRPLYWHTISPHTTGAWTLADGSDQTVTANRAVHSAVNTDIINMVPQIDGYFDVNAQVCMTTDVTKWRAGNTGDGLHANQLGNIAIQNSKVIDYGFLK